MGSGQSAHATPFEPTKKEDIVDDEEVEHHISISNKMVERLVEDATLTGGAALASRTVETPKGDYKDQIFMEKLRYIDEKHSERCGLTIEELKATAARIELRTANMISPAPVCEECKERVVACYLSAETPANFIKCWDTIGAFKSCVQEAAAARLREHTDAAARAQERRERHAAHARGHALRDLAPPRELPTS